MHPFEPKQEGTTAITRRSTKSATRSRNSSLNSRTGDVTQLVTTVARVPSSQAYASLSPLSSGSDLTSPEHRLIRIHPLSDEPSVHIRSRAKAMVTLWRQPAAMTASRPCSPMEVVGTLPEGIHHSRRCHVACAPVGEVRRASLGPPDHWRLLESLCLL